MYPTTFDRNMFPTRGPTEVHLHKIMDVGQACTYAKTCHKTSARLTLSYLRPSRHFIDLKAWVAII